MRRLLAILLVLGLACLTQAQPLELVESYPVESDFDQADIRNTGEVWVQLINNARHEIEWQTFYLAHEPGKATQPILDALQSAAERGVHIRFLVDEKFSHTYPETLDWLAGLDNVEVRRSPVGRWMGGVMHAKMILVDGQVGFIGSQNFDWRSLEHIRELGIVFRGEALVDFYSQVFEWEWKNYDLPSPPATLPALTSRLIDVGGVPIRPTVSPNGLNADPELGDEFQIVKLLEGARSSIQAALLSYSPLSEDGKRFYPELDNALRAADVRGVKVQLLVSHWMESKRSLDHLLSLDALDNVEVRVCRIPLPAEGAIPFARVHHSKYLVVDGRSAWLGTANWSEGYFEESRNYGMIIPQGAVPERLERLFEFDWARSTAPQKKSAD